jgi:hypothetical protein
MTRCQLATQPPVIICLVYGKWAQQTRKQSPLDVQRGSISLFSAAAGARCFADCFSPEQRRNINISVISTPISCTAERQPQRQGATSSLRISNYPAVLRLNSFLRINARSRGRHFARNSVGNSISLSRQMFACTLVCETNFSILCTYFLVLIWIAGGNKSSRALVSEVTLYLLSCLPHDYNYCGRVVFSTSSPWVKSGMLFAILS